MSETPGEYQVNRAINYETLKQVVDAYRLDNPFAQSHGIVMLWRGKGSGWKNTLRDPDTDRPGVLAFDIDGSVYVTRGGNDRDGAHEWAPLERDEADQYIADDQDQWAAND